MFESESILLQRFTRTGDSEAFSELVRRHAGLVYGACLRVLADKDRASDVAQDTFFQLLRSAHSVTGPLPNWLHRVATRKAIDLIRRDSSRRQRETQYAANIPHEVTKWQDLSPYVDEVLSELDDETRQVLIQHFFEGRTTKDIAATQGFSQPTVSRRIESGVTRLREKLHKRGIIITVGALVTLLVENAVQAAPAAVLQELGKMALVGTQVAVASGAATAASATGAGTKAAAGGVLAGVKAKIVTAVAVTAIGVGSVVTYQQITGPPAKSDETVTEEVTQFYPGSPSDRVRSSRSAQSRRPIAQQPDELTMAPSEPLDYRDTTDSDFGDSDMAADFFPEKPDNSGYEGDNAGVDAGYGAVGGMAMGGMAGGKSSSEGDESPPAGYGGYGGGGGFFAARVRIEGPNEPNDSNKDSDER
jgi:RNA polymerase sigma factor (sigma-70 family)